MADRATATGTALALGLLARSRALLAAPAEAGQEYEDPLQLLARTRTAPSLARAATCSTVSGCAVSAADGRPAISCGQRWRCSTRWACRCFAERTRVELGATGEHARRREVGTSEELTPQEAQIAALVSRGHANRDRRPAVRQPEHGTGRGCGSGSRWRWPQWVAERAGAPPARGWCNAVVAVARSHPAVSADAMVELAGLMFTPQNEYCDAVINAYRDEAHQLTRSSERERAVLVELIVSETASRGSLWEAAQTLRLPLHGTFLVVAAEAHELGHDPLPRAESALVTPAVVPVRHRHRRHLDQPGGALT